jgi:hypothetical protein
MEAAFGDRMSGVVAQASKPAEWPLGITAHESKWPALSLPNGPSDSREFSILVVCIMVWLKRHLH